MHESERTSVLSERRHHIEKTHMKSLYFSSTKKSKNWRSCIVFPNQPLAKHSCEQTCTWYAGQRSTGFSKLAKSPRIDFWGVGGSQTAPRGTNASPIASGCHFPGPPIAGHRPRRPSKPGSAPIIATPIKTHHQKLAANLYFDTEIQVIHNFQNCVCFPASSRFNLFSSSPTAPISPLSSLSFSSQKACLFLRIFCIFSEPKNPAS